MFDRLTQKIKSFFFPIAEPDHSRSFRYIFAHELDVIENDPEIGTSALIRHGEINGRQDMPPRSDREYDVIELKIIKVYERLILAQTRGYEVDYRKLHAKLNSLDPQLCSPDISQIDTEDTRTDSGQSTIVEKACSDMDTIITERSQSILNKREKVLQSQDEYETFKDKNGICDELYVANGKHKVKAWILIISVFLIETMINGLFFANESQDQYLHWWSQAVLISTVNIGLLALVIRGCWKYLYHAQQHLRSWAIIGLSVFILTSVIFNLGAAHFREAVSRSFPVEGATCHREDTSEDEDRDDLPGQEAICLLQKNSVQLAEFQGYAFFLLGLGFILFAVFEWRSIFPGYPEQYDKRRKLLKYQESLDTDCRSLCDQLSEIYRQAIRDLEVAFQVHQWIHDKYQDMLAETGEITQRCDRDIKIYRTSNRHNRDDIRNIPDHWNHTWEPDWILPDSPQSSALYDSEAGRSLRERVIRHLSSHYKESIEKVNSLCIHPYSESTEPIDLISQSGDTPATS